MFTMSSDIIILGMLAGFILYRLYLILGQKEDDAHSSVSAHNPVIVDISELVKTVVEDNTLQSEAETKLAKGFEDVVIKIRELDNKFSLEKFLKGAKNAFEMVLTAFAENDRQTLENLLDKKTYNQFISEIDGRIKNGINLNLTLVALPIVEIKNIQLMDNKVFIDVFYQSQQINILKNNQGEIIEGDVSQVDNIKDVWTFSKDLKLSDRWHLVQVNAS